MLKTKSSGFIKLILAIVVVIVLLAYFKINLRDIWTAEITQTIWDLIKAVGEKGWELILFLWDNFIREPALWVWQNVVLDWLWPLVSDWLAQQKTS